MQCPKCESEDLVKLSVIHSAGLSDINTRAQGRALAFGDKGLELGVGNLRVTGTSQTQLSKLAAPPRKKPYRQVILAWLLGLAIAGSLLLDLNTFTVRANTHIEHQFQCFAYAYSCLAALVLAVLWRYNHRILPRRHELWSRSFMCHRCGEILQPSGRGHEA
jgi:hypothetical protein